MMSSSTKVSDQCLSIGRYPDQEPKLSDLMTCLEASDDITNVTWVRGPIVAMAHEVECNPNQKSKSDTRLLRL
jgi:hypothetical protein